RQSLSSDIQRYEEVPRTMRGQKIARLTGPPRSGRTNVTLLHPQVSLETLLIVPRDISQRTRRP
ncbi:MAG: hypothetical protein VX938_13655, partial [Myxococcota bacterium]|nr:hypothetical protein [Myxococcota bacterium]